MSTSEIAIVIPAYNAARYLRRSLGTTRAVAGAAPVAVVDAGSSDDTAHIARALGAEVHHVERRAGPAEARNTGVSRSDAEVILFLDADCVPHADVVQRVLHAFHSDPGLVALSGSYDDDPPEQNLASSYMNLRHHFTHRTAGGASSFWAGCGAVRRKAFLEAGGFDAAQFPTPQIEDIELGLRLRAQGAVRIDPDLQVTHLKRWTLRSLVETDIRSRAIPWTRLILATGEVPAYLNLRWSQRLAALVAPFTFPALLVAPWAAWKGGWALTGACAGVLAASWGLNAPMLLFFRRRRGLTAALGGWLLHQLHLSYSAVVFLGMYVHAQLKG